MNSKKSLFIKNVLFNIILTVGIVIGVGIFFKNESIISYAHGRPILIVVAWVVGGTISVSSALAFSLLNNRTQNNDNNISEFVKTTYGTKIGQLSKWSFMYLYYPIYLFVIAIFTTSKMFLLFGYTDTKYIYTLTLIIVSVTLSMIFIAFTFFAERISKMIQVSTTIIKLIPFLILIVIVIGGIFTNNNHSYWVSEGQTALHGDYWNATNGKTSIAIIFWVIPAIKFTFDGFISVTANKRATSIRATSWGITIGMILVTVLYIVTTIAIIQEGVTNVQDAIISFMGADLHHLSYKFIIIKKTILAIVVISGLGSLNGFSIIWQRMIIQSLDDEKIKAAKTRIFVLLAALIFSILPWIILTLALGNGTDVLDVISDIVLLIGFSVNALVLIKVIIMKYQKRITVSWLFIAFAIIAIIGIGLTAGWKIIDGLIISQILRGNDAGIFNWPKWAYVPVFIIVIAQFVLAPLLAQKIMTIIKKHHYQHIIK